MAHNGQPEEDYDPRGVRPRKPPVDLTPAQYKTAEFQALQKVWYGKLKEDGFQDIELDPTDSAFRPSSNYQALERMYEVRRHMAGVAAGAEAFFHMAEQWLDRARWVTRAERWGWVEWVNGRTLKDTYRTHPMITGGSYSRYIERYRELRADMIATIRAEDSSIDADAFEDALYLEDAADAAAEEL